MSVTKYLLPKILIITALITLTSLISATESTLEEVNSFGGKTIQFTAPVPKLKPNRDREQQYILETDSGNYLMVFDFELQQNYAKQIIYYNRAGIMNRPGFSGAVFM